MATPPHELNEHAKASQITLARNRPRKVYVWEYRLEAVFIGGEGATFDFVAIGNERVADDRGDIGVALDMVMGPSAEAQADQVRRYQNLAVALRPGADADRGDGKRLADLGGQKARDKLHENGKRPRLLDGERIGLQPLGLLTGSSLNAQPDGVDILRCQPDMAHHRNADFGEATNGRRHGDTPFELDSVRATFLQEPAGVTDSLVGVDLIREEGHVCQEQRALRAAPDRLHMVKHLLHGDRQGGLVPELLFTERIPYEDNIDLGFIHQARRRVVVRGEHGDLLAARLLSQKVRDRYLLDRLLAGCAIHMSSLWRSAWKVVNERSSRPLRNGTSGYISPLSRPARSRRAASSVRTTMFFIKAMVPSFLKRFRVAVTISRLAAMRSPMSRWVRRILMKRWPLVVRPG